MSSKLFCKVLIFSAVFCCGVSQSLACNDDRVGLQNQDTRTVVYCYSNAQYSAEQCAAYYETLGYVRLSDIPSKAAKYDFLHVDTYPTRRWRSGELTPRW